jgi:putative membrane protein insertion efficiency factor
MRQLPILFIKLYQWIFSPYVGMHCRFSPSCSQYAIQSFQQYGVFKGFYLTIARILRCHPWHTGGHDPVP